jgi:ubiquinone/menaquinone biosynthesis C-methylase UbiE
MDDVYTHGHHASVVGHHAARTAANSAAFLLPRLRPGDRLADLGCGPGSITLDLAAKVAPGEVVGIDIAADVLEQARAAAAAAGVDNVRFETGDLCGLAVADATFDVVYAHQVLQHLTDPVAALVEMGRATRPGGTVAVRDADYGGFCWAPAHPLLDRWMELYHQVTERNGAEADAGRHLPGWVRAAGLEDPAVTSSTWHYADPAGRAWWAEGWHRRATQSAFATQAVQYGLSTAEELEEIAAAWLWWRDQPDGFFLIPHVEVLAGA